jgi:hypothetical protein
VNPLEGYLYTDGERSFAIFFMWEYPERFKSWWGDANTRWIQQLHGYMWNWNKKGTLVNVHQMGWIYTGNNVLSCIR